MNQLSNYLSASDNVKKVINSPCLDTVGGKVLSYDGQKVFNAGNRRNRRGGFNNQNGRNGGQRKNQSGNDNGKSDGRGGKNKNNNNRNNNSKVTIFL